MAKKVDEIGCAVIGYGPTYNIGKLHARWISVVSRMKLCAVCDRDPVRTEQAKKDFPGIKTYNDTKDLYANPDIEMVTVATPNFTHCALVKEALAYDIPALGCIEDVRWCGIDTGSGEWMHAVN